MEQTAIERIRQFIDSQKISERKFFDASGLPPGSFTKIKSIGSENLKKIFFAYPALNMDWVITGRGRMILQVNESVSAELNDTGEKYGEDWREKYYQLLEKYNRCLEVQNAAKSQAS